MAGIVNWFTDYLQVFVNAIIQKLTVNSDADVGGDLSVTGDASVSGELSIGNTKPVNKAVASGHATITLTSAEELATCIALSGTPDATVPVEATPTDGKVYVVANSLTGQSATIRANGETGVTIATGKSAIVRGTGTDFARVTADA